ncbi:caspase family protein [Azospirillum sp. TSO22-1]|uniref:caspase family protein n=1 Tax=Azospirillum sp. TSO22-1 TaxID=716789 RepID=UPI000D6513D7|nr:caspase family protein [Azospirillum sp. TSO22-1]
MVRRLIIAIALVAVWCGPPIRPALSADAEQRLALVIGNAAYKETPLKNPVNDAKAIAATLHRLGFKVALVTDASLRQMQKAILDFGADLKGGGVGLFYYAGHGVQVRGQNYLVPVDATVASEAAVRFEAVAVESVTEQMGEADNRVNLIILDACRNNPFERRFRGGARGLAAMDAARGTLVAYATAPGSVALDGDGGNGVYTAELLKMLAQPDLKAEEVFKRVRANVVKRTGGAQTPWESSSLTGDFVFNLTINVTPPSAVSAFDERQIELTYWNSIAGSGNPALFRAYLEQYPTGTFAALARLRIEELERKPPPAATSALPRKDEPQQLALTPPPAEQPVSMEEAFRRGEEALRQKNHTQARQWFRKAADQGHIAAQYQIGVLYEQGRGGKRDLAQARTWFRKAAEAGHADAGKALQRLDQAVAQSGSDAGPVPAGRAQPVVPLSAESAAPAGGADEGVGMLKKKLKENWLK